MLVSRLVSRVSRSLSGGVSLIGSTSKLKVPDCSNQLPRLNHSSRIVLTASQVSLLNPSVLGSSALQIYGFASRASSEHDEKSHENTAANNGVEPTTAPDEKESSGEEDASDQEQQSASEAMEELSRDDLVKLVAEKEELVQVKHQEIQQMKDKVLRTYAEMENVMHRTKREAENSKKFAIQNFAKPLLDVADNLERASSVVKDSFAKIDSSNDTSGVVPLLKTLLEGVEMTEKQLADVFKKFGVEKFDSLGEPFDPNKHNAVFQMPDPSKPPSTVAQVLKSGYVLYDRVIRPAEVGVTAAAEHEHDKGSEP